MEAVTQKKATMFRPPIYLVEQLKETARREHRSLNNFVECAILDIAYNQPNELTKASIDEARSGKLRYETPVKSSFTSPSTPSTTTVISGRVEESES